MSDFLRLTSKLNLEFFDSRAVHRSVDRAKRRALSKAGSFVRTRARSSMPKRKSSSPPGQPPRSHQGNLKRLLFFAWDSSRETVFVGPIPFGKGSVPELMEHGGSAAIRTFQIGGEGRNKKGQFAAAPKIVTSKKAPKRRVVYEPRPFMLPALEAEVREGTIPKAWANAVRR